jgi:hypothetical protein
MPTLGEFVVPARYLRRGAGVSPKLVDLPPMREGDRLTRAMVERLCHLTGIPKEDFGL